VTGKKLALIAAGVGGSIWLLSKLHTASQLDAQLVGLKLGDIGFSDGRLLLKVTPSIRVTNSSNAAATANAFAGTLYTADGTTLLGTFNLLLNNTNGLLIPARGSALIDVAATIDVINSAAALLQNAKSVMLDATVTVNGVPVPIRTDIAIGCACSSN